MGGIGLGIGYISPVSTLIKWFPDRPGLATGLAIMGFGGGALVASPLSRQLLSAYDPGYDPSVATSVASGHALAMLFVTLGIGYFAVMMLGVANVRVPAARLAAGRASTRRASRPSPWSRPRASPRPTPSGRRSSGCCGSCCSATSPPASASSSRPAR